MPVHGPLTIQPETTASLGAPAGARSQQAASRLLSARQAAYAAAANLKARETIVRDAKARLAKARDVKAKDAKAREAKAREAKARRQKAGEANARVVEPRGRRAISLEPTTTGSTSPTRGTPEAGAAGSSPTGAPLSQPPGFLERFFAPPTR